MSIKEISDSINRYDKFIKATWTQREEYRLWKRVTDLEFIEIHGVLFTVAQVGFLEYLEWMRENEEIELIDEVEEIAEFEVIN